MLSLYTELSNVNKGRLNELLVTITIEEIYGLSRGVTTLVYTPQLTSQTLWVDTLVVLNLALALTSFWSWHSSYLAHWLRTGFNGHLGSYIGTGICLF